MNIRCTSLVLAAAIWSSQPPVLPRSQSQADAIVQELRQFPAPHVRSAGVEERRSAIHSQLRALGQEGVAALARALSDADVMLRRNVLLALYDLGHGVSGTGLVSKVDIRSAVPALVTTFRDPDASVRAWSIQAIEAVNPLPLSLLPALNEMLKDPDSGVRLSACGAVGLFGVAASQSRANLERLTSDDDRDIRTCAGAVLRKIESGPH